MAGKIQLDDCCRMLRRRAAILAYVCQLVLNSLPALEHEIGRAKGHGAWEHNVRRALKNLCDSSSADSRTILQGASEAHGEPSAPRQAVASD